MRHFTSTARNGWSMSGCPARPETGTRCPPSRLAMARSAFFHAAIIELRPLEHDPDWIATTTRRTRPWRGLRGRFMRPTKLESNPCWIAPSAAWTLLPPQPLLKLAQSSAKPHGFTSRRRFSSSVTRCSSSVYSEILTTRSRTAMAARSLVAAPALPFMTSTTTLSAWSAYR